MQTSAPASSVGEALPPVLRAPVDHDALLVAVPDREAGQRAGRIAGRRLDLDDLGAVVAKEHAGHGPGDARAELDDADAFQRPHAGPPKCVSPIVAESVPGRASSSPLLGARGNLGPNWGVALPRPPTWEPR